VYSLKIFTSSSRKDPLPHDMVLDKLQNLKRPMYADPVAAGLPPKGTCRCTSAVHRIVIVSTVIIVWSYWLEHVLEC